MLEIVAIVAVILAIAIAAILVIAATKPNTLRVQRALSIKAPADRIFPLVNDFHKWKTWSPYENKDPAMKRTYGGADSGKGAVYAWDGDKNVGSGRMEILDVSAASKMTSGRICRKLSSIAFILDERTLLVHSNRHEATGNSKNPAAQNVPVVQRFGRSRSLTAGFLGGLQFRARRGITMAVSIFRSS